MTNSPIRVFLVDDDPLVRDVLTRYFHNTDDITVVGTASNGAEALELIEPDEVDIVLSDVHMPQMDGATLLKNLAQRTNTPAFLAITSLENDRAMLDVLAHGGRGYILKSQPPEEIVLSVRQAITGGTVVSPAAMNNLVQYIDPEPVQPSPQRINLPDGISDNEVAVLDLLCEGLSNAEIAKRLNYSESTVKKQVSHLLTLFGVSSRLDLVVTVLNGRR
ncbi:response regulator [Corynebacterium lujinxingii]|uniref:Response regulator transcription factor n=1 Tax=Corynebacterium lujinxingii TaxID=2763010 RepID=A0A7H0K1P4_9CORY|nr:response regulator transcription factor [Corynebacterium lujinxingii]MBC3178680.1 response regulator transcription factor [Corynebacterium lujinxingii]NNO10390.1 response regulator [Corynebacterium lujinxingii]QNP91210.1 response regulator transcription factor [Corynebacterium lujinxingii]